MTGGEGMGRMDGETTIDVAGEAWTIDAWRRECERLREDLIKEAKDRTKLISEYNDRTFEQNKLNDECERLRGRVTELEAQVKAERQCVAERDEQVEKLKLGAVPPGVIREIEFLHIIIKHMAPLL